MKLSETVEMMNSTDYKDRFRAEYHQLKNRCDGLRTMLDKYKSGTLSFTPTCSYELLYRQLVYMENYENILVTRAIAEGITFY